MSEFKPCPNCKREITDSSYNEGDDFDGEIRCKCGLTLMLYGRDVVKKKVIDSWNKLIRDE